MKIEGAPPRARQFKPPIRFKRAGQKGASRRPPKSHRKVLVVTPDGEEHEYRLPHGAHVNVREAVVAGDPLMDGPIHQHSAPNGDVERTVARRYRRASIT